MPLVVSYYDAYVFIEPHRKEPHKDRLTICCHGAQDSVCINSILMTPQQVAGRVRVWANIHRLHTVRLLACHSASQDPNIYGRFARHSTFGARLSALLPGILVKAYAGTVSHNIPHDGMYQLYNQGDIEDIEIIGLPAFRIIKNDIAHPFHCITYRSGLNVK